MPQIKPKSVHDVPFVEASRWILIGYFFKLFVANNLNEMTAYMDFPLFTTLQTQDRWLLIFLYSYQIYADFFGYSAIAIGFGAAIRLHAADQFQPALRLDSRSPSSGPAGISRCRHG